jgi:pyridinium-3,5-biscarboxylic acid mononucleotide sulfurtransferase
VPKKLAQVEAAEVALRALGFTELRVRHHGEVARIELPVAELWRTVATPLREAVQRAVSSAGFRFIALDGAGVQAGAFTLPLIYDEEHHDSRHDAAPPD